MNHNLDMKYLPSYVLIGLSRLLEEPPLAITGILQCLTTS